MILAQLQRFNRGGFSPLQRLFTVRDELDRLFQQAAGNNGVPTLDLFEDKENLVARFDLPGRKKEDIAISLDDGVLTVSGEGRQEANQDGTSVHRRERAVGAFARSITLPYRVDEEKIKAVYTDGVLTVTLPKAEEAKLKQIPVENN